MVAIVILGICALVLLIHFINASVDERMYANARQQNQNYLASLAYHGRNSQALRTFMAEHPALKCVTPKTVSELEDAELEVRISYDEPATISTLQCAPQSYFPHYDPMSKTYWFIVMANGRAMAVKNDVPVVDALQSLKREGIRYFVSVAVSKGQSRRCYIRAYTCDTQLLTALRAQDAEIATRLGGIGQ